MQNLIIAFFYLENNLTPSLINLNDAQKLLRGLIIKPIDWKFPYESRRMPLLARNVVATSQPLAAQAGLRILLKGGNAVDAALAAAIALVVVEPTSCGIGGDAFAIVWDGKNLIGLNASGRSPAAWSPALFAKHKFMPSAGWDSVTVPGVVSAWADLSAGFGKLPFTDLFEPAIEYARNGFIVSPITAAAWARARHTYKDFPEFAAAFLPGASAPKPGQKFAFPAQAKTLERIARTHGRDFYTGDLAAKIVTCAKATGGHITADDLAAHKADWVDTISLNYRGLTVHEIPPNGQGLAALIALGILQQWEIAEFPADSTDTLHLQIEAMKLALADAYRYVADPDFMDVKVEALLDPDYLASRARPAIDPHRAKEPEFGTPPTGGTVYLTAADTSGMMVSFIQSNYMGFGSGIVIPGTGISMQNRGAGFTLEKHHPNCVAGRKRPFHTIIPGFIMQGEKPLMSFGVMGGPMQPQGHVQMIVRIADYGQNPQAASDAPRWRVLDGLRVGVEDGFEPAVLDDLMQRGHKIVRMDSTSFGGAQTIYRLDDGYLAASDHRKDGQPVGF